MRPDSAADQTGPDKATPQSSAQFWTRQLTLSDEAHKDWHDQAASIVARYANEKRTTTSKIRGGRRFNILFSNTETLHAAIYAKTAKPDVRRRWPDRDPAARQGGQIIERALDYCADVYNVDSVIDRAVRDYLLPGRPIVRVVYEPVMGQVPQPDPMTGQPAMGPDGAPVMVPAVVDRKVYLEYVHWRDFRHATVQAWEKVWWIAFKHVMDRDDLIEHFGEDVAREVPLNWAPAESDANRGRAVPSDLKRAEVWEVWSKRHKRRLWVVKGYSKTLREDEDPYNIEGFYPMPEPPRVVENNDSLIPVPHYEIYKDQADALDEVNARVALLTQALRRRGVYDASIEELRRLARAGDNEFIPVKSYAEFASKGGLKGAFETEDISTLAVVLAELQKVKVSLIGDIYAVTGISDILRGTTDPNETLGAQELKMQQGSARLKKMQRRVQMWVRDLYRIKAELITENFDPKTLSAQAGLEATPEIMAILKDDKARSYRIDIETDSTVFGDSEAEKRSRMEVMTAVGAFVKEAVPLMGQAPELVPFSFELLAFLIRSMKAARPLEDILDQAQQAVMQRIQQAQQQPPQPDPKAEGEKIKLEATKESVN